MSVGLTESGRGIRSAGFVAVLCVVVAATALAVCSPSSNPGVVRYSRGDVLAFLARSGVSASAFEMLRDASGTGVVVYPLYLEGDDGVAVAAIDGRGVEVIRVQPKRFYLDDNGDIVAWWEGRRVRFRNGETIDVPLHAKFAVAPGAEYFIVEVERGVTDIRSTRSPATSIVRAPIRGDRIFVQRGRIYVFARRYQRPPGSADGEQYVIICRIFRLTGLGADDEGEVVIPNPGSLSPRYAVEDVDPSSSLVLLVSQIDPPLFFLASRYSFDLETKELRRIGRAGGHALFLQRDVLRSSVLPKPEPGSPHLKAPPDLQ